MRFLKRYVGKIGLLLAAVISVSVILTGCKQDSEKQNSSEAMVFYNDTTGLAQNHGGQSQTTPKTKTYPYDITIFFDENLLNLETYYVDVYLDDELQHASLKRTESLHLYGNLDEGSHTLVFKMTCKDKPTVSEEVKKVVNITKSTNITARFVCKKYRFEMTKWEES